MNKEILGRLADKILEPDYERGHGTLRELDGKMCPLGVLCELYRLERDDAVWGPHNFFDADGYTSRHGKPPKGVREWAGVDIDWCHTVAFFNDIDTPVANIAKFIRSGEQVWTDKFNSRIQ